MGVSDARRLEVYEQARAQWGEGPAEALMEMVVPAGQEMATRQDVEGASTSVRSELQAHVAALRGEIAALRAEMVDRFAKVEARLAALEERSKHLSTRAFVLASHIPTYGLILGLHFR